MQSGTVRLREDFSVVCRKNKVENDSKDIGFSIIPQFSSKRSLELYYQHFPLFLQIENDRYIYYVIPRIIFSPNGHNSNF